jgi:hypothetical protein
MMLNTAMEITWLPLVSVYAYGVKNRPSYSTCMKVLTFPSTLNVQSNIDASCVF